MGDLACDKAVEMAEDCKDALTMVSIRDTLSWLRISLNCIGKLRDQLLAKIPGSYKFSQILLNYEVLFQILTNSDQFEN